jgi:hypothetical protein
MVIHIQNSEKKKKKQGILITSSSHSSSQQRNRDNFRLCPLLMMLLDEVLETSDYPLLKAIISFFILQWPAAEMPRVDRDCSQG